MNLIPRICVPALVAAALTLQASAGTLVRDLGQGLSYYRVHALPSELPSTPGGKPGACILDLRFAKSDQTGALALRAWIKFNASARTPIFVLENSETEPAILAWVPEGVAGLLVLAPESAKLGQDISVRVAADLDRKAYEALEKGAPIESLLSDYPAKPRFDEEHLEKEHLSDTDAPEPYPEKPPPPPAVIDAVLQRAVQLHRGLLALKRI